MKQLHECIENPSFSNETSNMIGLGFWQNFLYMMKAVEECPDLTPEDKMNLICAIDKFVDDKIGPHDEMAPINVSIGDVPAGLPAPEFSNPTSVAPEVPYMEEKSNSFSLKRMRQLSGITKTEDLI